jgi:hypothetical protein
MENNLYKNLTASGQVAGGRGILSGVIVNSQSSGTIKLWDNTTAAVPVMFNTMTLSGTDRTIWFLDSTFNNGLYVTIGGTADITVIYRPL